MRCQVVAFLVAATVISHSLLLADDWDPGLNLDQGVTLVSLGSSCEIAIQMQDHHLRKAAFPFDWLLTCNHDPSISLLENDFAFFLDDQYLIQHPVSPYVIENCYYKVEFRHDWPSPELRDSATCYSQQLQEMRVKYARRINRFRDLAHYPGKVFFIRTAYDPQNDPNLYWGMEGIEQITAQEAQELKDVLERYFPSLDFTLIIVNYIENNVKSINCIDKVVEFKISKHNKHSYYTNIFNALLKL